MNALLDIAFTLGLLVLLLSLVAMARATARTLTNAAATVSCRRRQRSDSAAAKQMLGAKTAKAASMRASEPETRPFLGILIHHPDVKVTPTQTSTLKHAIN
jgi:hypothetical protein